MSKNDNFNNLVLRIYKILNNKPANIDDTLLTKILDEHKQLKEDVDILEHNLNYYKKKNNKISSRFLELMEYSRTTKKNKDKLMELNKILKDERDKFELELYKKNDELDLCFKYIHKLKDKLNDTADKEQIIKLKKMIDELNHENTQLIGDIESKKGKNKIDNYFEQLGGDNEIIRLKDELDKQNEINRNLLVQILDHQKELKEKDNIIFKIKDDSDNINLKNINLEIENRKIKKELENLKHFYNNSIDDNVEDLADMPVFNGNPAPERRLENKNNDTDSEINVEYESDNDTYEDETDDESTESETDKNIVYRGNKHTRKTTGDFFKNCIKEQMKEDNKKKETPNIEKKDYSYSTDYLVELLQNSNKLVPKDKRIPFKNRNIDDVLDDEEYNNEHHQNIFVKHKKELESIKEELKEELEEAKNEIKNIKKEVNFDIEIKNKPNNNVLIIDKSNEDENNKPPNNNLIGGKNKSKVCDLYEIDNALKLCIKNEFTTLTDQNINRDNINEIRKSYNRKAKRRQKK